MQTKPNLLFVMTDHQRADSLGMRQAGEEVTPRLNRFAESATSFARAYNACPLCVPARTAIATGLYPTRNGVVNNDWEGQTAGDHKPLHQYLSEAGYDVAHIGNHHIRVAPDLKERVPFSVWLDQGDHEAALKASGFDLKEPTFRQPYLRDTIDVRDHQPTPQKYSNTHVGPWPRSLAEYKDNYFTSEALAYLNQPPKQPFALFVYLWAPHPPLWIPDEYQKIFDPSKLELPENVGQAARGEPRNRRESVPAQLAEGLSEEQWRETWAGHLALVRLADDCFGNLLDALDGSGRREDTLTVFLSDHGDHLGQHGMYQKMEMYEQAVRTPLVIRAPKTGPGAGAGRVGDRRSCETPVSHLDLLPTVLDYAGIPLPGPEALDGISLRSMIDEGREPEARTIFSQYSGNFGRCPFRRAAITERYKYVFDPEDVPELYDLQADPLEMNNIASDPAFKDVISDLHGQLRTWHEAHGDFVDYGL